MLLSIYHFLVTLISNYYKMSPFISNNTFLIKIYLVWSYLALLPITLL